MFDNNVFIKGTCKNVKSGDKIIGFQMKTHITYYRSLPLSMVNYIKVVVDGVEVPRESIRFSVDDIHWFTLDEMTKITEIRWDYGFSATVRVLCEGGLPAGEHEVTLTVCTRTAHLKAQMEGNMTRKVVIK